MCGGGRVRVKIRVGVRVAAHVVGVHGLQWIVSVVCVCLSLSLSVCVCVCLLSHGFTLAPTRVCASLSLPVCACDHSTIHTYIHTQRNYLK